MTSVLLAPHNDDETLFASFLVQAHNPMVVVVLASLMQAAKWGVTADERERETRAALFELGHTELLVQGTESDVKPDWAKVEAGLLSWVPDLGVDTLYAPAVEVGGHVHHNMVGTIAARLAAKTGARLRSYLTYTRDGGRSRQGVELVPEPGWIAAKHRALACYLSQIDAAVDCRPWFLGDLREYVLP